MAIPINSAKEKAKELIDKFSKPFLHKDTEGFEYMIVGKEIKECALIAVDEIIKSIRIVVFAAKGDKAFFDFQAKYWKQVKSEINKL